MLQICDRHFHTYILQIFYRTVTYICHISVSLVRDTNLEKHGYKHLLVNHSKEFVNKDGDHTNKIEGHWHQAKAKCPTFGIHKYMFLSYLAEFLWRYEHKGENLFEVFLKDALNIYKQF